MKKGILIWVVILVAMAFIISACGSKPITKVENTKEEEFRSSPPFFNAQCGEGYECYTRIDYTSMRAFFVPGLEEGLLETEVFITSPNMGAALYPEDLTFYVAGLSSGPFEIRARKEGGSEKLLCSGVHDGRSVIFIYPKNDGYECFSLPDRPDLEVSFDKRLEIDLTRVLVTTPNGYETLLLDPPRRTLKVYDLEEGPFQVRLRQEDETERLICTGVFKGTNAVIFVDPEQPG